VRNVSAVEGAIPSDLVNARVNPISRGGGSFAQPDGAQYATATRHYSIPYEIRTGLKYLEVISLGAV
jgi:hypothetical protein